MTRIAILLFILQLPLMVAAQEWEVGLQGGASGYMGDLNPENPLAFNDWSAGVFVKYNLDHTWGIRGNFAYANTYAHDIHSRVQQRRDRNLGFFGPIMEAAVLVDFNFFKWLPQRGRIVYTPYIFAGVGGIYFDPQWEGIKKAEGVNYKNQAITIPFGAGFKYNLRGPWSVGAELGYRLALTDYLDDVSARGDGRPYDSFMTLGITLSYTIFKGGCPEWQ